MAAKKKATKKRGTKASGQAVVPVERIEKSIYLVRGEKVMLDEDLAELYGTTTSRLNEQVTRNIERFPEDFAFHLSIQEFRNLKSHSATSSWGGRRKPPRAFTEHGALMAASVLNTPVAVQSSVQVVRTFIRMRALIDSHRAVAQKLHEMEKTLGRHDKEIRAVFEAVRQLLATPEKPKRRIGFRKD